MIDDKFDPRDGLSPPKTLQHAIYRSFCVGPLSDILERAYITIKSFIIHRVGIAITQHPECEEILKEVLEDIIKRDFAKPAMTIDGWKKK